LVAFIHDTHPCTALIPSAMAAPAMPDCWPTVPIVIGLSCDEHPAATALPPEPADFDEDGPPLEPAVGPLTPLEPAGVPVPAAVLPDAEESPDAAPGSRLPASAACPLALRPPERAARASATSVEWERRDPQPVVTAMAITAANAMSRQRCGGPGTERTALSTFLIDTTVLAWD
jgi:hypothetical protein